MQKAVLIISIILNLILGYIILKPKKQPTNYQEKVDSIEVKIDSIKSKRDSIKVKIDTITIKIKDNEKQYKKDVNTIISNNSDEDYLFFINYLKWNRERHDSINNSSSIKGS